MKAFRIEIDGQRVGDFGVPDFSFQALIFNLSRGKPDAHPSLREDRCDFSVSGLTERDETGRFYDYRWSKQEMPVGMRVTVEVVESENCLEPVKRVPDDTAAEAPPFTKEEQRAMWYEDYLRLKKEFEG
ncbi:MAG: hypothetical protein NT015_18400 [Alphaproteobacteria bacterium]|nr:hypothetical protein [Alphaproteobacteria bacterium]